MSWATLEDILAEARAADNRHRNRHSQSYPSHMPVLMERTTRPQFKDDHGNVSLEWVCPHCLRWRWLRVARTKREEHPPLCFGRVSRTFDGIDKTHAHMIAIYQQDRERQKWLLESMQPVVPPTNGAPDA